MMPRLEGPLIPVIALIASGIASAVPGAAALSGVIAGGLGVASGTLAFAGIQLAVAGVLGFASSFLISQLVKPPKTNTPDPVLNNRLGPTLRGVGNELRPYQPVPAIFGEHRIFMPLAAPPSTETNGGTTTARQLFTAGIGPIELSEFRIGDVAVEEFEGATTVWREGGPNDTPDLTIFSRQIAEQDPAVTMKTHLATDPAPRISEYFVRATADDTTEIILEFGLDALIRFNDLGEQRVFGFALDVSYQLDGTSNWLPFAKKFLPPTINIIYGIYVLGLEGLQDPNQNGNVKNGGNFGSGADQWTRYGINGFTQQPFFISLKAQVESGKYNVRVRRVETSGPAGLPGNKDTSAVRADLKWTRLRSLSPEPNLSDRVLTGDHRISTVELTVPITNQIGGFVQSFNALAKGKWSIYDPTDPSADPTTGWTAEPKLTRNPASAFVGIFTKLLADPLPSNRFDWQRLSEWWTYCDDNGLTCDVVVDAQRTATELAEEVASTGRASFDEWESLISVAIDSPKTIHEQVLTPNVSQGLTFEQSFIDPPHAVLVKHIDTERRRSSRRSSASERVPRSRPIATASTSWR
jgi:hypothetical protein